MSNIKTSVSQLIGATPLVQLRNLEKKENLKVRLLAKVEGMNPAGSAKDRVGLAMIEDAEKRGLLQPGGTIILCAEMADGLGGEQFYRDMADCETPEALFAQFSNTAQDDTVADQWQTQILCRVLKEYRVIWVTRPGMEQWIKEMKMEYAPDLATALEMAGTGSMTVIPDGVSVCICE